MATTANQEYKNANYDRLAIWIKKGKRDEYKQAAAQQGMSLAAFLTRAADLLVQYGVEDFANHAATDAESPAQVAAEKLSADERRLVEEFAKLPADAQKHFLKAFAAVNSSKGGGGND